MKLDLSPRARLGAAATAIALVAAAAGYGVASLDRSSASISGATEDDREVLYWYDPMYPNQHFDKPGKSPFMDMELVPKSAGEAGDAAGVRIDPALVQSLGLRTAEAHRGPLGSGLNVTGPIGYHHRDLAIVKSEAHTTELQS